MYVIQYSTVQYSKEADSLSIPRLSLELHDDDQSTSLQRRGRGAAQPPVYWGRLKAQPPDPRGRPALGRARLLARVKQLLLNPKFMRLLVGFTESQQQQQQRGVNKG
jgi:hypothetical protein